MSKLISFISAVVLMAGVLSPGTASASIIFNGYNCATHFSGSALSGAGLTCSGTTLSFTNGATQSAANNGTGNTLINIYGGAGTGPWVTVTTSGQTGTLQMRCFGDTNNCNNVNLSAGSNVEVALTSPTQSSFEYIVFGNNGNTATGNVNLATLCIDNDGVSCAPATPAVTSIVGLVRALWIY